MTLSNRIELSVILPTYNRLNRLKRVLAGLAKQSYPIDQFEVLVVADGCRDETNSYLQTVETPLQIKPILQSNQGVAAARNHGISRALGQIVLFIDDDVVPEPQLIAEHWRTHQKNGENVVVMGPMFTPPDFAMSPWVHWEQTMLTKQYDSMMQGYWQPTARQFYTGNTSLAHKHLVAAGGFDPSFRRAEDVELAYRLADQGLSFLFNPDAVGYHYAERSFSSWLEIPYTYGRNDVIFTRQKGQIWLLPVILHEFHGRHPFVKWLTQLCLDRPRLSQAAITWLNQAAHLGHHMSLAFLPRYAYSGIFNLRHYQGIADEIGGRAEFFNSAAQAAAKPIYPLSVSENGEAQPEQELLNENKGTRHVGTI